MLLAAPMTGQQKIHPVLCGNDLFSDILRQQYPDLQKAMEQTFDQSVKAQLPRRWEPLTIPVVVHVVWKNPEENLHDSILLNQLAILNEDFNRLNPDTAGLRSIFKPVAGNADIHFELASIVRVQTDQDFAVDILGSNLLPEVKHDATGGSEAWDPDHYLNIWVCKIQPIEIFGIVVGQILGFSFPPNNLANWPPDVGAPTPGEDGVVIDFRVFGSNNPNPIENPTTLDPLVVKGRTPVHEVGHYLGLRHIWGDGGLLGPNDCAQSDGIEDTPFANAQSEFDCDTTKNTCAQVEPYYQADMPDLIENYMDYASESCMNMFTQGQVDLMRNVLQGPRSGLIEGSSAITPIAYPSPWLIYPNPARNNITIKSLTDGQRVKHVQITDINGRILVNIDRLEDLNSADRSIQLPDLPAGIYMVRINGSSLSQQQLLVIHP